MVFNSCDFIWLYFTHKFVCSTRRCKSKINTVVYPFCCCYCCFGVFCLKLVNDSANNDRRRTNFRRITFYCVKVLWWLILALDGISTVSLLSESVHRQTCLGRDDNSGQWILLVLLLPSHLLLACPVLNCIFISPSFSFSEIARKRKKNEVMVVFHYCRFIHRRELWQRRGCRGYLWLHTITAVGMAVIKSWVALTHRRAVANTNTS